MKVLFTFLFLCLSFSIQAQPQKGDFFMGTNAININSTRFSNSDTGQTNLGLSPIFGIFLTDNTLLGARIGANFNLSSRDFFEGNRLLLSGGIFCSQYVGKGKVRGISTLEFNAADRELFGTFRVGPAIFINDFSSVELSYNLNILKGSKSRGVSFFEDNDRFNLGLTLKSFLLNNREGVENLSAINSIKKGVIVAGGSGNLIDSKSTNNSFISASIQYFAKDNLFFRFSGEAFDFKSQSFSNIRFTGKSASVGAGYYHPLNDFFFTKVSVNFSAENSRNLESFANIGRININRSLAAASIGLGAAIFSGRHKFESNVNLRSIKERFKDIGIPSQRALRVTISLDYEYFLSPNLSVTGEVIYRPHHKFHFVSSFSNFPSPDNQLGISQLRISQTASRVGFNWYF